MNDLDCSLSRCCCTLYRIMLKLSFLAIRNEIIIRIIYPDQCSWRGTTIGKIPGNLIQYRKKWLLLQTDSFPCAAHMYALNFHTRINFNCGRI